MAWVIWLTGLPGSGKTTIAHALLDLIDTSQPVELLRLDAFRKRIIPSPSYTEEERDMVYNALGVMADLLHSHGVNVVVDATAHRKKWRDRARACIDQFHEVYVKCPLDICMERESQRTDDLIVRDMYRKALERKRIQEKGNSAPDYDVGEVIGIDVPYEEPDHPELIIETDTVSAREGAHIIYEMLHG
ncbi:MAG: adenylyl-sulfate kinase [Candidatus Thorarchaeota archaeon]|jgi:adenylylsulfate kinase